MPLNEPSWWYPAKSDPALWQARLLAPIAAVYAWASNRKMLRTPDVKVACPVICVGNFTAGGTGKTPLACWLADFLKQNGFTPAFLTRGYGGREHGPVWLDAVHHTALDVGDEPFLLARHGAVMIARDRAVGAQKIVEGNKAVDVIIMDDGLQNASLHKDLRLAVVDGLRGFGNGRVIPSGPLRATLSAQAAVVDAVVFNQRAGEGQVISQAAKLARAELENVGFLGKRISAEVTTKDDVSWLNGARVLAFAGIGNPDRFFALLRRLGADVVHQRTFKDHQVLLEQDAKVLLKTAKDQDLILVTTEKDAVRVEPKGPSLKTLQAQARVLPIQMLFSLEDERTLSDLVLGSIKKARQKPD